MTKSAVARLLVSLGVSLVAVTGISLTGCTGGGGSSSGSGSSTPPPIVPPTVASISPASVPAGSAATAIMVTGSGFSSSTTIQVGGTVESTTYASATQVSATVSAEQLAQGGTLQVIALNGDATSAAGAAVDLAVNNPVPAITELVPAVFISGSIARSVSVLGTGFVPTTTIQVNGNARPTTFVTSTEASVVFLAADIATGGSLTVTAVNPAPAGGSSAAASVPVNNPLPRVQSLSPSAVVTTAAPATITVTGLDFYSGSVVQINGLPVATTFVSSTQLSFQLTAAQQSVAGLLDITVVNAAPGGGASFSLSLNVSAPTPTPVISFVNPSQFLVGSPNSFIYVSFAAPPPGFGTPFGSPYTVEWNGTALTLENESYGQGAVTLGAAVPASLLAVIGTAKVTVSSLTSTPATSTPVTILISNPPPPTLTSLYPNTGPTNTATAITLSGSAFTTASTVAVNGVTVPATYSNSYSIALNLTAAELALPGNINVTVTTPGPGGGTTAPLTFTAYIGIANNSVVYNPANGLFYASVPSSAGAPYGNSIVSVDPETGALGTPIPVGSEPNKLALSSDGTVLWVGLDGASAVRQVNLTTGVAGTQFSLSGTSFFQSTGTALALAALPGSPDSVVVSSATNTNGAALAIYDNGIARGPVSSQTNFNNQPDALQVDGTKSEIYAAFGGSYMTYTYGASGLTPLATSTTQATYATSQADEIQVTGGRLYTDFGGVYDAESGSLLGTLYSSGTNVASGATVADTTLGKVFLLDSDAGSFQTPDQIQVFNLSDFTLNNVPPIRLSVATNFPNNGTRLTRWGTDGLAFRTALGLYSLRSNAVKDLSTTSADVKVTLAATGTNATGTNTTYTATVSNAGPTDATNVGLSAIIPASGVLVSVTPSAGTCSTSNGLTCNLGGIANGASVTVAFVVQQTVAGSAALSVQVSASENDPTLSNNLATSTVTVSGNTFYLTPTVAGIVPAAIQSGASDTVVAITGTGFTSASTVQLGTTALTTSYSSSTSLSATVPAAQLTTLGWSPLTVSNPAPGGGTSTPLPLSVYSVLTLGVNHILYDPYSRNIMASVGSGSSTVTGNSIIAITPGTATVGTPVPIGSQPTNLALTDDGQILYTTLIGSRSVARYNMLTQAADFTYAVLTNDFGSGSLGNLVTQPGTENTIVLDANGYSGAGIYDFDPVAKNATVRASGNGPATGSCMAFLDGGDLLSINPYGNQSLDRYSLTSSGFTAIGNQEFLYTPLNHAACFKLSNGVVYTISGGVANAVPNPAVQLGVLPVPPGYGYGGQNNVAPDAELNRTYFAVSSAANNSNVDSIEGFDNTTFLPTGFLPLGFAATEGANASFTVSDLVRWGQDGLAVLTSTGHIYLVRGAAVVPEELAASTPATLASSSPATITHGGGNLLLTLTGSNFLPGVAVNWNGSYRTTTIVDATHVTVAIPASDLTTTGSASLTAVNPGAVASAALTLTIN